MNVCFTPGGYCTRAITHVLERAKTEIPAWAYSLMFKPVADTIAKAKETCVTVLIILGLSDDFARNCAIYLSFLKGNPINLDAKHVIADNNIITVDKATVVTGSIKFTNKAEVKMPPTFASSYRARWQPPMLTTGISTRIISFCLRRRAVQKCKEGTGEEEKENTKQTIRMPLCENGNFQYGFLRLFHPICQGVV